MAPMRNKCKDEIKEKQSECKNVKKENRRSTSRGKEGHLINRTLRETINLNKTDGKQETWHK